MEQLLAITISMQLLRFIAGALGIISWCSLALQWVLLKDRIAGAPSMIWSRYFSYFTIITNCLVTLCYSLWFIFPISQITDPILAIVGTAINLYIIIVSLVYYIILRKDSRLSGLHRLVSRVHHGLIPVSYVLIWYYITPMGLVPMSAIAVMLLLPVLYLIYVLYLGRKNGFYPYPFIDVSRLGFGKVLLNSCLMTLLFALLAFLLILLKS